MKHIIRIVEKYRSFAENLKIPFGYYLLTFAAFVTLRNFLEIFSDSAKIAIISFEGHFHYFLFYLCLALTMTLLFSVSTGEKVAETARLVTVSFFFIFLAPLLDLLTSGGQGLNMAYLLPGTHSNLMVRYLTFAGPFEEQGITIGLKLEVAVLVVASFLYFSAKQVSILKSIFFSWVVYTVIFGYAVVPFVIKGILDLFGLYNYFDSMLFVKFYLILLFPLLLIAAHRWDRKAFVSILKDIRPFRQIHALMMFAFGIVLGPSFLWSQEHLFDLAVTALAIVWGCVFVITTNNLADQEIDRWVNKQRPLVNGAISCRDYQILAVVAGILAIAYAWAASYYTLFTLVLFMGLYSVYSLPPVRFKRVPFFSKLVIAVNSLAFVIMGYVFTGGEVTGFPPLIILWFLVFFTAAMNFIDIKDYSGDKRAGIKTLPVLWGFEKSQRVIGLFFLLACVAAPFAVGQMILLAPSAGAGIAQYWLISRKNYKEKWVFSVYLASFAILIVVLGFARQIAS
jgi:4-hydroxybenzoate polyprenyltransferase